MLRFALKGDMQEAMREVMLWTWAMLNPEIKLRLVGFGYPILSERIKDCKDNYSHCIMHGGVSTRVSTPPLDGAAS